MPLLANINVGSSPNDGTGNSIRDSFIIVNENFQFVESFFPNTSVIGLTANITSTGNSAFNNLTITGTTTSSGNISANYVFGNGSQLTSVAATTSGTATFVTGNTQANITSVGILTGLTVTGNLTGSNISAGIIGNTSSSLVGTLATPAQTNITSVGTLSSLTVSGNVNFGNLTGSALNSSVLSNVFVIVQSVLNEFTINAGATSNVRFATNRSNFSSFNVNANVTFLYPAPITSGIAKTIHVKNISGATRYIILPNTNNNKGANTIPVSNGTVATFTFVPYDTTEANVAATIIND
jgi:hypothetical protein